jgi:hypothetical protein
MRGKDLRLFKPSLLESDAGDKPKRTLAISRPIG